MKWKFWEKETDRTTEIRVLLNSAIKKFVTAEDAEQAVQANILNGGYPIMRAEFNTKLITQVIGATIKEKKDKNGNHKISFIRRLPTTDEAIVLASLADRWASEVNPRFLKNADDDMSLVSENFPVKEYDPGKFSKVDFLKEISSSLSNEHLTGMDIMKLYAMAKKVKTRETIMFTVIAGVVVAVAIGGVVYYINSKKNRQQETSYDENNMEIVDPAEDDEDDDEVIELENDDFDDIVSTESESTTEPEV